MTKQMKELKSILEQRYNKSFTEEKVNEMCVAIIYNGIVNKGWKLNGVNLDGILKEEE